MESMANLTNSIICKYTLYYMTQCECKCAHLTLLFGMTRMKKNVFESDRIEYKIIRKEKKREKIE